MQISLLRGREFTELDNDSSSRICIVNERLARMFGVRDPVGRTLRTRNNSYEIVGLVHDAIAFNLKEDYLPVVYFPYLQGGTSGAMIFQVRTASAPLSYAPTVRQMVRQMDSRIALSDIQTEADHIDEAINSEITLARVCTVFAALALTIACIGLYGTVAFNVAKRSAEIGIRMALGAQAGRILRMVLREIVVLAFFGLVVGLPVVLGMSRYVKSLMYGVEPNDPLSIAAAVLILIALGLLAALLPARRAARIDPMISLRHE
jgi:ABC-type antimicrobial peptide transport system permease subunit